MEQNISYFAEGSIDLKKQVGHNCNTGAEIKQLVTGEGYLSKTADIYMINGLLTVDDKNEIKTAESAIENLAVTSTIKLCSPPKRIFKEEASLYISYIKDLLGNMEDEINLAYDFAAGEPVPPHLSYLLPYWFGDKYEGTDIEIISKQIWAASIIADPGYEAVLNQDLTAAFGPYYGGLVYEGYDESFPTSGTGNFYITGFPSEQDMDSWWLLYRDRGLLPVLGNRYVGDYFTIEQLLNNRQGVSKCYIDISSPWSHGYLSEDMTVVGKAEVKEAYEMLNLPAGSEITADWWSIEGSESSEDYRLYYEQYLPSTGQQWNIFF